jgi:hypothetical protein
MHLKAPEQVKETVERVHTNYAMHCPLYRTLHKTIHLSDSSRVTGWIQWVDAILGRNALTGPQLLRVVRERRFKRNNILARVCLELQSDTALLHR